MSNSEAESSGKILPELCFPWRGRRYGFVLRLIRSEKSISQFKSTISSHFLIGKEFKKGETLVISYTLYFSHTFLPKFPPNSPLKKYNTCLRWPAFPAKCCPPKCSAHRIPQFLSFTLSWEPHNSFFNFFSFQFFCVLFICSPSFLGSGHLGVTVHRDCAQVLRQQK